MGLVNEISLRGDDIAIMRRENLAPKEIWDSKPFGFAQAVAVEEGHKILFIAGQAGMDKSAQIVGKDFDSQCKQAFDNIALILKSVNADFHNIVKVTAFFTDVSNLATFGKIASEYFKGELPAQSVFEVKNLALPGLQIEIEAIAVL